MLTLKQLLEPNQNQNKTKNISKTIVFDKLWVNRDRFGIKKTCKERRQNFFCQKKQLQAVAFRTPPSPKRAIFSFKEN